MTVRDIDKAFVAALGRRLRERRGTVSAADAARAVNRAQAQITRYEDGVQDISAPVLARLAKRYGCSVGDFFDGLKIR